MRLNCATLGNKHFRNSVSSAHRPNARQLGGLPNVRPKSPRAPVRNSKKRPSDDREPVGPSNKRVRASAASGDSRAQSRQAEAGGRQSQLDVPTQPRDRGDDNGNHARGSEPDVTVQADDFVKACYAGLRIWYNRAIQCANAKEMLRMPDKADPPKYCNPFAGFTAKDVAQWTLNNSDILKEQQDEVHFNWSTRLLPQEELMQDRRKDLIDKWNQFSKEPGRDRGWTYKECKKFFYQALEVFDELGTSVLPNIVDSDGRDHEERRILESMFQTAEPLITEQWRRYIKYCTNIIDNPEDLNARLAQQATAIEATHNGTAWVSPPSPRQWPSQGFEGKKSGVAGHRVHIGELSEGGNGSAT